MDQTIDIILNTSRLILRTSIESDDLGIQDFEDRNKDHLSPWESTTLKLDSKSKIRKWKQDYEEGKSIRFLLFLKNDPSVRILGFCNS